MNSIKTKNDPSRTSHSTRDISTLRVAQSELVSGDTNGKVYIRLSAGAVAFLNDRPKVQQKLSGQIRQAVLDESAVAKTSW
jgi:hypothetical protein